MQEVQHATLGLRRRKEKPLLNGPKPRCSLACTLDLLRVVGVGGDYVCVELLKIMD